MLAHRLGFIRRNQPRIRRTSRPPGHHPAGQAQQTAQQASTHTAQLGTTVANLDQYSQITDTELHFRSTQTALNDKAKAALDQVAQQLAGQKGYIVEVQGYTHARGQVGIERSQNMADAVVRYLVIDHQVPVYRIYRVGMGNAPLNSTDPPIPPEQSRERLSTYRLCTTVLRH